MRSKQVETFCLFDCKKLSMLRFEVTTAAAGSEMQPNAATQLGVGVQQVARRPQTQLLLARDQDDFDALDLEEN
jgi:hypothetical protein